MINVIDSYPTKLGYCVSTHSCSLGSNGHICARFINVVNPNCGFLAHLSTKCSVSFCDPSMSGVRRPSVRASVRPSVRASTISLNYISSETAYWILTKLHRNDPLVVPYQSCSNRSSWLHK